MMSELAERLAVHYYNSGLASMQNGDFSQAADLLRSSLSFEQDYPQVWNLLGLCYYRLGCFDKAGSAWKNALAIKNDEAQARSYLENLKGIKRLAESYNRALEYAKNGHYWKALLTLYPYRKQCFHFTLMSNLYGHCLYKAGFKRKAIKIWQHSLTLDRGNRQAWLYLKLSNSKEG